LGRKNVAAPTNLSEKFRKEMVHFDAAPRLKNKEMGAILSLSIQPLV
jgi:hypothetical protein